MIKIKYLGNLAKFIMNDRKNFIFLSNANISKKINLDEMLYLRVDDYLLSFYLENKKCFSCCKSMGEITKILPSSFLRINRYCIVNKNKISHLERSKRAITLNDGSKHVVSHRRMKEIFLTITG